MSAVKFAFAFCAMMLTSVGFASAQQVVKVGVVDEGAPYSFIDAKTKAWAGIYPELMNAIVKAQPELASKDQFKVEFVTEKVADLAKDLIAGKIDMVAHGVQLGPEDQAKVALTDGFYSNPQGVKVSFAFRKDSGPLLTKVNTILGHFQADGTLKNIFAAHGVTWAPAK